MVMQLYNDILHSGGHRIMKIEKILLIVFIPVLLFSSGLKAEPNPACSETLFEMSDPNDPLGYKVRGERCEGRYLNTSGSYLHVVSFTQFFESYNPESKKDLTIDWSFPATKPLFIRAVAVAPSLYYRMDTQVTKGDTLYRWPIDILSALKINDKKLGVIAWMNIKLADQIRRVHIPIKISQTKAVNILKSLTVIIQSASPLSETYYSLSEMDLQGRMIRMLVDGKALEHGFYPRMEGIRFTLDERKKQGLYLLEITAVQQSGVNSDPVEFWFYSGGNPGIGQ